MNGWLKKSWGTSPSLVTIQQYKGYTHHLTQSPVNYAERESQSWKRTYCLALFIYHYWNNKILEIGNRIVVAKAMATHSSTLAWKIPWMEEPGRLRSIGSLRVGHDWATSLSTVMHWRRKWQPTPVFLPGESQGRGSLVGCRLWGRTESDTSEAT